MNNSHILGLAIFGACAFFAVLTWVVAGRVNLEGSGWSSRGVKVVALVLLLGGLTAGYGAFAVDNRMRATTLCEKIVEGSADGDAGATAPVRRVQFVVEHPDVEHTLSVDLKSNGLALFAATVAVRLVDERNSIVLSKELKFLPQAHTGSDGYGWPSRSLAFTPRSAERYTLFVTPLTHGIPSVHVHIADPLKRNGTRLPGY